MNYKTEEFVIQIIETLKKTKKIIKKNKNDYQINKKANSDFVTTIDIEIEDFLKQKLLRLIPDSGFIAEESNSKIRKEINWIVDPIDGTTNFINGLDYTISVALEVNNEVQVGIIYQPRKDVVHYAIKGQSAVKWNFRKNKVKVLHTKPKKTGIIITGLPYNKTKIKRILGSIEVFNEYADGIRIMGPVSLDICRVAEGKAILYTELDLKEWDYAAGKLILEEAGGRFNQDNDKFSFYA